MVRNIADKFMAFCWAAFLPCLRIRSPVNITFVFELDYRLPLSSIIGMSHSDGQ